MSAHRDVTAVTPERVYFLPHPALRKIVSHYTVYTPNPAARAGRKPERLHLVPDASGCIVCPLTEIPSAPILWGPMSRVAAVEKNAAQIPLYVFAEFLPAGAHRLLGLPMHSLENARLPLADVDPELAAAVARDFDRTHREGRRPDSASFLDALDRLFLARAGRTEHSHLADFILASVSAERGAVRVGELAARTGYSERHLARVTAERLGLGIKSLSRIVKINNACAMMATGGLSLTALAHGLGYHDQSHFIRDFRETCGIAPGAYLDGMSDFYNEGLKMTGTMPEK